MRYLTRGVPACRDAFRTWFLWFRKRFFAFRLSILLAVFVLAGLGEYGAMYAFRGDMPAHYTLIQRLVAVACEAIYNAKIPAEINRCYQTMQIQESAKLRTRLLPRRGDLTPEECAILDRPRLGNALLLLMAAAKRLGIEERDPVLLRRTLWEDANTLTTREHAADWQEVRRLIDAGNERGTWRAWGNGAFTAYLFIAGPLLTLLPLALCAGGACYIGWSLRSGAARAAVFVFTVGVFCGTGFWGMGRSCSMFYPQFPSTAIMDGVYVLLIGLAMALLGRRSRRSGIAPEIFFGWSAVAALFYFALPDVWTWWVGGFRLSAPMMRTCIAMLWGVWLLLLLSKRFNPKRAWIEGAQGERRHSTRGARN